MGSAIVLDQEKIVIFENEDISDEIDISTTKVLTASRTLIQSLCNQAEENHLRWNWNLENFLWNKDIENGFQTNLSMICMRTFYILEMLMHSFLFYTKI
jgi:hypothetical protein